MVEPEFSFFTRGCHRFPRLLLEAPTSAFDGKLLSRSVIKFTHSLRLKRCHACDPIACLSEYLRVRVRVRVMSLRIPPFHQLKLDIMPQHP
jgi:hypothetical protein